MAIKDISSVADNSDKSDFAQTNISLFVYLFSRNYFHSSCSVSGSRLFYVQECENTLVFNNANQNITFQHMSPPIILQYSF